MEAGRDEGIWGVHWACAGMRRARVACAGRVQGVCGVCGACVVCRVGVRVCRVCVCMCLCDACVRVACVRVQRERECVLCA